MNLSATSVSTHIKTENAAPNLIERRSLSNTMERPGTKEADNR